MSHRVYLAGGFIRAIVDNEPYGPSDADLFGLDQHEAIAAAHVLIAGYKACYGAILGMVETENAITLTVPDGIKTPPVQIVTRWPIGSAEEIIEHFDFTVCAAAVWHEGGEWHSLVHSHFYDDIEAKQLIYNGSDVPGGSLLRAFKYARRHSYFIGADQIAAILEDIETYRANVEAQTNSPMSFIAMLREVDPLDDGQGDPDPNPDLEIPF